jgi:hypothetical protein
MTSHQIKEALRRRDNGEPMRDIARSYNVSLGCSPGSGAGWRIGGAAVLIANQPVDQP